MPKTLWRISDDAFNLDPSNREKWSDLLRQVVSQPGLMLKAYSAIHGYGLGNQLGLRGAGIVRRRMLSSGSPHRHQGEASQVLLTRIHAIPSARIPRYPPPSSLQPALP